VVMVSREKAKKKGQDMDVDGQDEYKETYADLVKLVQKAGGTVRI